MLDGFFKVELLKGLPSDNLEACVEIFDEFRRFETYINGQVGGADYRSNLRDPYHEHYLEALAILRAFTQARKIELEPPLPLVGFNKSSNIVSITNAFLTNGSGWTKALAQRTSTSLYTEKTGHYNSIFASVEVYAFSDADLKRIQELINELRSEITASHLITADHKRRLLKRLEAMQRELHKNATEIDRFWGFIGEAGIVARKFGEDLKPITDRVAEIGRIVTAVILLKEGVKALPEITKLLDH